MSEFVFVNNHGVIWLFTQTQEAEYTASDGRGMSVVFEGCGDNFLEFVMSSWDLEFLGEL